MENAIPYSEYTALKDELDDILETMEIPVLRREDMRWLARNIEFRNSTNPQLDRAKEILKILIGNEEL